MKKDNKNILIVDALVAMRRLIETTLQAVGYKHFFTAENGVDALSICRDNAIDLIITNWEMPKMDGLELLKNIRVMDKTQNIPLLMITTETDEEKVHQAINSGVNDFIVKPFTPETLYKKLELVFTGKLPYLKPGTLKQKTDETTSTNQQKKPEKAKILIVDDLPSNIDVIVGILKSTYKIRIATNGKKALEIANTKYPPDLILLDIMMPEMDGMEVCSLLKSDPHTMDIPVIFLTAKDDSKTAIEGFSLGAVDYINKPVDPALLMARVNNHIDLKKAKDSLKKQVYTLMENARLQQRVDSLTN
ncbi:MAG: response regulator [Pseudomonadota bacterium]